MPAFERYIGIDYSGAETPTSRLRGLRLYSADRMAPPAEIAPSAGAGKYWSRRGIAEWLAGQLADGPPTLVGIDHGFSFPLPYFETYGLPHDWQAFLDDFQRHWPTDQGDTYVDFVREGHSGNGAGRSGDSRWRRVTDIRARAKSVFHFDVPGSVAKSTHAGLPWLRFLRHETRGRAHFWPFDGWDVPAGSSAIVEVYPALWIHRFGREGRDEDQHAAYAAAEGMRLADMDGSLARLLKPYLQPEVRRAAEIDGWILGVS